MESRIIPEIRVISHRAYNLKELDNLQELPVQPAIFGIFAIVDEKPANCRYIGETENLYIAIKDLYEINSGEGLQKFMQGPWIKMLQFLPMPGSTTEERISAMKPWIESHNPKIDS